VEREKVKKSWEDASRIGKKAKKRERRRERERERLTSIVKEV